jgi:hypothetical protein
VGEGFRFFLKLMVMETDPSLPRMERRMAALFLLALILIAWQALRTKPVEQPPFESATKKGERLLPTAVASWHSQPDLSEDPQERLQYLEKQALSWPGTAATEDATECKIFVRFSSQHWSVRPASSARMRRWLEHPKTEGPRRPLRLPVQSFLDDDDGDGDPLDDGELRWGGPGADVEVFCRKSAQTAGGLR